MTLKEDIRSDLHSAMRKRDRTRVSVLRLLLSNIGYEEIDQKKELDESGVIAAISRQVRQRRESIDLYRQGNRQDLVDQEEAELAVLQEYLPAQLSPQEIENIVRDAVEEVGATGPQDKGKVMGLVVPKTRGKAEGSKVNDVVTRLLQERGG